MEGAELEEEEEEEDFEDDEEEEETADDEQCDDGTGAHAWPTGVAMAAALKTQLVEQIVRGKTVLELGAGSGVVGLAAHAAGARSVLLTDRAPVLPQLRRALEEKPCSQVEVEELVWGSACVRAEQTMQFDVVLASDVLYNTKTGYGALAATLRASLGAERRFLLGCRWRKPALERRFFATMEQDFEIELVDLRGTAAAELFCSASLGWKDFGNPRKSESNRFLLKKIMVAGVPTPCAEIDESAQERLTDAEHKVFESMFTQLYIFTRRSTVDVARETRKRKAMS